MRMRIREIQEIKEVNETVSSSSYNVPTCTKEELDHTENFFQSLFNGPVDLGRLIDDSKVKEENA